MPSLTRAEATARAAIVSVTGYTIDLDLTGTDDTFRSRTVLTFEAEPGSFTFAELEPVELLSASLNGKPLDAGALSAERLTLPALAATNELVVEAVMRYSHSGEGLHRFVDPADGRVYTYAQMFLDGVRRVFPCFDQPDLKAPFTLTVTTPADWIVAANGELAGPVQDGVWRFGTTKPLSTYLASLIAGPYHACTDEHDGIPLAIYARQALKAELDEQAEEIFTITKQCLDRYHEIFDVRYPFGHYGQAFVPEFNFGAMENPGIVVLRDEYIFRSAVTDSEREQRAMVIAHEMAHQWFGDLVTMAWWDDLWLNESFAEYLGSRITAEATQFRDAWTTFAMQRKAWGIRADQRPSTHPVAPEEVADTAMALLNFDGISYAKGASVLRQLVTFVGDKAFLAGLNDHFAAHAYGNATLADLLAAVARASGRDLTGWADAWLRSAQVNTLRAEVERAADGTYEQVAIVQTAPEGYPTLRPHKLFAGLYDHGADGTVTLRKRVEVEIDPGADGERTVLAELAGEPAAGLLLINDGDLAYAKIRLDDASAEAVPMILPLLSDPLARAVLWSSMLDAVTDAERPVAELVTLVLAALPVEREVVVVEDVLATTRGLVNRYPTEEARPAALELLAQACDRLLAASEPGSSLRLAAMRGLVGATADTVRLKGWLAGDGVPEGVAIDDDLAWLILYRLVVLGAAGAQEIEARYQQDRSAFGEQWAARCRAAVPDAEAKARAWDYLINDPAASNRLLEATAQGFWHAEQLELITPYAERYFTDVPAMLARRGGMSGERVAVMAYPSVVVSEQTRQHAAALLAAPGTSSIMHRVVTDGDDDMRRALLARFAPSVPA
ncbi:aminopeptidase N [Actinoplanes sp. N902-109]|uniref:aminopeptidase N n=1 Tax=Actinoplanes sp. (strain N902-109) TaxID=649831 RepID=UPI0005A2496F|nr:aminopeptidase N [Actinoplanes sp. N902-109]